MGMADRGIDQSRLQEKRSDYSALVNGQIFGPLGSLVDSHGLADRCFLAFEVAAHPNNPTWVQIRLEISWRSPRINFPILAWLFGSREVELASLTWTPDVKSRRNLMVHREELERVGLLLPIVELLRTTDPILGLTHLEYTRYYG